ncbi:MAG: phosphate acyltransferase PlsX [Bacilli bacterium]
MKIAIDAMGGDRAPQAPVQGTLAAARELSTTEFLLVGRERDILAEARELPHNVRIVAAAGVIAANAEPVRSVRRQTDSSLVVCTALVRDGLADGMVSAGNTGAFMVAGLLIVGRMEGILRPALATVLPTFAGRGALLLDAGANTDSSAQHLLQWAAMGQAYMRLTEGLAKPRVGLLNIGAEAGKGNELCKAAYPLLQDACPDFVGNVEARDLLQGVCDVIVCDGFVGNVLVKFYEGVGLGLLDSLKKMFLATPVTKLAALALKGGLRTFRTRFDYAEYGGGPFLGVRGVLVKAHGSSNARAFEMALRQAHRMQSAGLAGALEESLRT